MLRAWADKEKEEKKIQQKQSKTPTIAKTTAKSAQSSAIGSKKAKANALNQDSAEQRQNTDGNHDSNGHTAAVECDGKADANGATNSSQSNTDGTETLNAQSKSSATKADLQYADTNKGDQTSEQHSQIHAETHTETHSHKHAPDGTQAVPRSQVRIGNEQIAVADEDFTEHPGGMPGNIYNSGIAANFAEVLWPRCHRKRNRKLQTTKDPYAGTKALYWLE